MVKRQKERQYESSREHRANSALRAGNTTSGSTTVRKLPFHCCALSLMPFETPVCTSLGIVFDKTSLETFWKDTSGTAGAGAKKLDPVTGKTLATSDLIALTMDRDEEGRWQCPIMTKPFADHTKIVAIVQPQLVDSTSGMREANVYSYEAYHELNLKAKNYHDLTSGLKFHKTKDVIVLNDPEDLEQEKRRDINSFYHIQNQRQLEALKSQNNTASGAGGNTNIRHSVTATRILDKIQTKNTSNSEAKKRSSTTDSNLQTEGKRLKLFSDEVTGVKYTAGTGSLTSTAMTIDNDNAAREATEEEILQGLFAVLRKQKRKGYVKLQTSLGDILLEIHCDYVPRTATNFIRLCQGKQYNGSKFHRLIPNFMIQGGKQPSTSSGEKKGDGKDDGDDNSIWGGAFQDEFHDKLKHDGPGILSMANAGPNTNRRQFFLTFQPCEHLNKKHSVFGCVIQGMDVLKAMEKIPVDKKDRPKQDVMILDTIVVDNPVEDAEESERKRIFAWRKQQGSKQKAGKEHDDKKMAASTDNTAADKKTGTTKAPIGRYLPKTAVAAMPEASKTNKDDGAISQMNLKPAAAAAKPKPKAKMKFGNFSGW